MGKLFLERINYFTNWQFNFQKARVIGSLRYIDEAINNFVTGPFDSKVKRREFFFNETGKGDPSGDPRALFYEEALFLNHIINSWSFDQTKLSKYEQEDYHLACKKLKDWNNIRKFMQDTEKFIEEIKRIITIRRSHDQLQQFYIAEFPQYEWSLVCRYHAILHQLEPYPEWREKFKIEVEGHINMLAEHSPVPLSQYPLEVFINIDLHKYFR